MSYQSEKQKKIFATTYAKLIEFLERNLNPKRCDALTYAIGLLNKATEDHFEIRGFDSVTGNPITAYLSDFGIKDFIFGE